ncbi:MAG: biotin carboxylase N-terminal domain-containing protein, partial [bacterium]
MFKKVLIANRGEIAMRVMRACKDLGVRTAVLFSEADRDSLPVKLADEVYPLGGGLPSGTYLNIDKIIEAAKATHSDAIHPGYGFLSENHDFARACKKNGIVFIGPTAEVIQFLGDKVRARTTAARAGVHTTPGSKGVIKGADEAKKVAKEVGYPIMLKAVAGGGGRGMRVVNAPDEMEKAFQSGSTEAMAAFGNGTLFLEKYIQRPRHIEVQILGDEKGNIIHLFERECSIQRRHQKLVEESPSPALDARTRTRLTAAALRLARAVDYTSAGT